MKEEFTNPERSEVKLKYKYNLQEEIKQLKDHGYKVFNNDLTEEEISQMENEPWYIIYKLGDFIKHKTRESEFYVHISSGATLGKEFFDRI